MPVVNGLMYSELYIHPHDNDEFRIMILQIEEGYLHELMEKIRVLEAYLNDREVEVQLKFYIAASDVVEANRERYGYETFDATSITKDEIKTYAKQNNIDLVFKSDDKAFIKDLYKDGIPAQLAETVDQLENEIEAFLTGKNVAWNLNHPVWNTTWFTKDVDELDITEEPRKLRDQAAASLGYTPDQLNYARALVNKVMQIRHCEEILLSYVQKKNHSERNHTRPDVYGYDDFYDYSYEINYHLGNYYFLISGTMDIIGRLLVDVYGITNQDVKPNIEHSNFQLALSEQNPILAYFFADADINYWMIWLKRKRNYVAHESEVSYTDVLRDKETQISNDDLEERLLGLRDWQAMKLQFGEDKINAMMDVARSIIRMKEDHEIYTKNAMQIKYTDHETREPGEALFHPLIDIKADYERIKDITNIVTKELQSMTPVR